MGKFSTLSVATSGLMAAQAGLYVTGHNMANTDTVGFSRQQALQNDFMSVTVGRTGTGAMQVGLGTDVSCIRQIRDKFLDISYRQEAGKYDFYAVKSTVGEEMEAILGELQSQYSTDSVIKDLFNSLQELSIDTSSLATRGTFVSTAITFIDKASDVYNRLLAYQYNLNEQVIQVTHEVNQLLNRVNDYNKLIMSAEMAGDNANDFRDSRNVAIDRLSHLLNLDYKEKPNGQVDIFAEGKQLCVNGVVSQLGFRYTAPGNSLVEPVFTESTDILAWDEQAVPLFQMTKPVDSLHANDSGQLLSLMVARGLNAATYASDADTKYAAVLAQTPPTRPPTPDPMDGTDPLWNAYHQYQTDIFNYKRAVFNENYTMVPKMMKEFDTIINKVVTMINNAVAPYATNPDGTPFVDADGMIHMANNAPYDLNYDNKAGTEIFVRQHMDRYTGDVYNGENPDSYFTLYTSGNLMINPKLLEDGGYNLIALMVALDNGGEYDPNSTTADPFAVEGVSDPNLVLENLLKNWKDKIITMRGSDERLNIDDAYRQFINILGIETSEAQNFADEQATLLVNVDNKRQAIMAVSLDEEMRNMMTYQHAYNAAARVINTVDSMIDKLVNGTGRAGR